MGDCHSLIDLVELVTQHASYRRSEVEHPIVDQGHDDQGREPLASTGHPEASLSRVGHLVGAIGEATRPLVEHLFTPQDLSHA